MEAILRIFMLSESVTKIPAALIKAEASTHSAEWKNERHFYFLQLLISGHKIRFDEMFLMSHCSSNTAVNLDDTILHDPNKKYRVSC